HNWVPWKHRVTAIFCERADPDNPMAVNFSDGKRWEELDGKGQTQIELTLSDSQIVHIAGAKTAAEMWKQLKQVKERGNIVTPPPFVPHDCR
ncbi:hypothetical protein K438DRAFT_1616246, partial [Mycena galopus ATCC 62051]